MQVCFFNMANQVIEIFDLMEDKWTVKVTITFKIKSFLWIINLFFLITFFLQHDSLNTYKRNLQWWGCCTWYWVNALVDWQIWWQFTSSIFDLSLKARKRWYSIIKVMMVLREKFVTILNQITDKGLTLWNPTNLQKYELK